MEQLLQIATTLFTFLIAAIATVIAYRQWRTAQDRINLDLFERRLAVYEKAREAVSIVYATGKISREAEQSLLEAVHASQFLFREDIQEYLTRLWKAFSRMTLAESYFDCDHEETRLKNIEAHGQLRQEVTRLFDEAPERFAHYMRMDHQLRRPKKVTNRARS